jgi:hypothetical protein
MGMSCKVYKTRLFEDDMEVVSEGSKNILTYKRRPKKPEDKNMYFEATKKETKVYTKPSARTSYPSSIPSDIYYRWNGGCETVNLTGKRSGLLCNHNFYIYRNNKKICQKHAEVFIDTCGDDYISDYSDEYCSEDEDFIAPENDGTKIINGKVWLK